MAIVAAGGRITAVAFTLGMLTLGPQGLGLAAAEGPDADATVPSTASSRTPGGSTGGPARRGSTITHPTPAESVSGATVAVRGHRAATERLPETSAGLAIPAPESAGIPERQDASGPDAGIGDAGGRPVAIPAASVPTVAQLPAQSEPAEPGLPGPNAEPLAIQVPSNVTALRVALPAQATPSVPGFAPAEAWTASAPAEQGSVFTPPAPANAVAAPAAVLEAVNNAVTGFFDSTAQWLSTLPASPVTDLLSGALLLVRRSLFNQLPAASSGPQTTNSAGVVSGRIIAVDPERDPLTYTLTVAPKYGTVEIGTDGQYLYTPANTDLPPGYIPIDSFTVAVADNGFNLLKPFSDRATAVTVGVPELNPGPPAGYTRGFDIKNLTGQAVYLTSILKESGYESSIASDPVGTILKPGESTHVELTKWAFYAYDTRFVFNACTDVQCTGGQTTSRFWKVMLTQVGLAEYNAGCFEAGICQTQNGEDIGVNFTDAGYARGNSTVVLVDQPDTEHVISGADAQKQLNVVNSVCTADGHFCQFTPSGAPTHSVKGTTRTFINEWGNPPGTGGVFPLGTKESVKLTASSSFGTTFTTEVGGSYGEKDVFNVAFKQTFSVSQTTTAAVERSVEWNADGRVLQEGQKGVLTVGAPSTKVTGTFIAQIRNTKFTLQDVGFEFLDPNNPSTYTYDWKTEMLPKPSGGL